MALCYCKHDHGMGLGCSVEGCHCCSWHTPESFEAVNARLCEVIQEAGLAEQALAQERAARQEAEAGAAASVVALRAALLEAIQGLLRTCRALFDYQVSGAPSYTDWDRLFCAVEEAAAETERFFVEG